MKTETGSVYRQRILKVLLHIQERLDEPLSLEDLASIACFSPFHFHRIFRGLVGESVKEHIRRLRLERAALRLAAGGRNILEIALDAGYETHESFTRAFQAMFDEPPSSYRRRRAARFAAAPSGVHFEPSRGLRTFQPRTRGGKAMKVRIEKLQPKRVAFVRHIGPYQKCGAAWGKLCSWAGPKGLLGPRTACIGISYDDPEVTPLDKIRYDACVTVSEGVKAEGEIGVQEIPGGEFAIFTHQGPLENLLKSYQAIFGEWAPKSGRVIKAGPGYEVYLNDPNTTPPEKILIDIHVALEPKK
jgi:AraC family transcriptional regulator